MTEIILAPDPYPPPGKLAGTAFATNGARVRVAIWFYLEGRLREVVLADAQGRWESSVLGLPGPYGITYKAEGCAPVSHGPYVVDASGYVGVLLSMGPLAYWPLDEDEGSTIHDLSPNELHATLLNSNPTLVYRGTPLREGHPGAMGFSISSSTQTHVLADDPRIRGLYDPGKSATICCWMRAVENTSQNRLLCYFNNYFAGTTRYRIIGGGQMESPDNTNRVSFPRALNTTYFIVWRKNVAEQKYDAWVNGVYYQSTTPWSDPPRSGALGLQFPGVGVYTHYGHRGYISDMALFERALDDDEAAALYTHRFAD